MADNPLLEEFTLPPFSRIKPEHVVPAVDTLLQQNRDEIRQLLQSVDKPDWKNFVEPIERLDDRLNRAWSPVSHMNSVVNSDELREAYNACLPKLSAYATEMGQNADLYRAYKAVQESDRSLDAAQKKMLENILRDFHLSGVDLPPAQKQRYKEISERLSTLTSKFSENLLDATHAWTKQITDESELAGLPPSALDLARQTAQQRDMDGWLLTLEFPSYYPVMTYADNRDLRYEMYRAYSTRASDQGPNAGQWDNAPLIDEMLALRHQLARLLGFDNWVEYALARRMAETVAYELDMKTVPKVHISAARLAPMTWWSGGRVRVVLPRALRTEVDDAQLRWILAHELAHIKRRDHIVRWLEWLASAAFWWNPVVWWAQRNLRRDEEDACDALVLERLQGQPRAYARTLLTVVEVMAGPHGATPALATGIDAAGRRGFRRVGRR